ncbi:MAG: MFS transporter [Planctomycetales bacterium]|nr:MFS transporter [Planctomycetales bacterium]
MSSPTSVSQGPQETGRLPMQIVFLGLVSFLTDVSSEAIFAVLPVYFVVVLGGSAMLLGLMEGLADLASSSLDLVSGVVSDKTGKRKGIAFLGYLLSALAKVLLLLTSSALGVVCFRVVERLGKSIRGAPRDALLAAIASQKRRGIAFGIHKAFDKAGAILGPFAAYLVLSRLPASATTFGYIFLAALVPAFLAVAVMGFLVKEKAPSGEGKQRRTITETVHKLGPRYRWYLLAAGLFSLGYFSFAFLILKAKDVGFDPQQQTLLYGLFNLVFTVVSIPLGWLSDSIGRSRLVAVSYIVYALLSAGFMMADSGIGVICMFVVYGVFYALDEVQSKAFLSDLSTDETRATAIGIYNFVTGLAYLPASLIAGVLWNYSPGTPFLFAIGTSLAALALFVFAVGTPQKTLAA